MSVDTPASPSGFPSVDERWGGFQSGSAYMIVGRASHGRHKMALQAVLASVQAGKRALLISPRDKNELVAAGQMIGLDLPGSHATGRLRLLRIPGVEQLSGRGVAGLVKAFDDFRMLIRSDRPDRVVVEDFTPMVQFDTFEGFQTAFQGLLDEIVESKATLVLGLGQPGNDASRQLLDIAGEMVDGVITLSAADGKHWLHLARRGDAHEVPAEAEQPPPLPTVHPSAPHPQQPEAPGTNQPVPAARDASGIPISQVIRPPDPSPDLLEPGNDTFGSDPADEIVGQGYLVDSHAGRVMGRIPMAPTPHTPTPAQAPPPAFAPLTAPPSDNPRDAFLAALQKAYSDLPYGTPFLVVAVRMEPTVPDAEHFGTVAAGLQAALRPQDDILIDAERKRAAVLLPGSGSDAVQPLYSGLQSQLRMSLGDRAESVLRSVGAVSVPNGQPFKTPAELLAYAIDS